jgi:hypothetical protein
MPEYALDEIRQAYEHFKTVSDSCAATGDYNPFADLFTEDCTYIEHAFGEMHGREEVRAWIVPLPDRSDGAVHARLGVFRRRKQPRRVLRTNTHGRSRRRQLAYLDELDHDRLCRRRALVAGGRHLQSCEFREDDRRVGSGQGRCQCLNLADHGRWHLPSSADPVSPTLPLRNSFT